MTITQTPSLVDELEEIFLQIVSDPEVSRIAAKQFLNIWSQQIGLIEFSHDRRAFLMEVIRRSFPVAKIIKISSSDSYWVTPKEIERIAERIIEEKLFDLSSLQ